MPLPDADPDKRMYKLLKNIDLENLTFAQFQSTAQTVFAEPEAEDTLRRIVLINLARMSVAGDWNGLTTTASGGGISLPNIGTTNEDQYLISNSPYWGTTEAATTLSITSADFGKCLAFPFISPLSGTLSDLSVQVSVAGSGETTMYVGIYSENAAYLPGTLLGYATMNTTSTGTNTQTSFSSSVVLVKGSTYWYTINMGGAGTSTQLQGSSHNDTPNVGIGSSITETGVAIYDNNMSAFAVPPSTFQASMVYSGFGRPLVSIRF